ncbi:MAG: hypothetical protein Q7T55_11245 [Solirubrobacteraceae bacterium]|nr:hypothetical protein [Solirubrobacteraceae bacterium]
MRRSTIIALGVLLLAGLAIGALWASMSRTNDLGAGADREIAALRDAESKRRPASGASSTPPLCKGLDIDTRGTVQDPSLDELSGLVVSRRSPSTTFWAIEDSGAEPVFSVLRSRGTMGSANWTAAGAANVDWEDLATGPGPSGPVLYAADIGDNDSVRESVSVYRVTEPVDPGSGGTTAPAQRLELTYPDGAHDAETLLVDPRRGTLVIVTKGLAGGAAYAVNPPAGFAGKAKLRKVGPVPIPLATGGDISSDGRTVAVRGYFSLSVWRRRGDEAITQTLRRSSCTSPTALTDGQGEALALSKTGTTAWTVAEGTNPKVQRLRPQG